MSGPARGNGFLNTWRKARFSSPAHSEGQSLRVSAERRARAGTGGRGMKARFPERAGKLASLWPLTRSVFHPFTRKGHVLYPFVWLNPFLSRVSETGEHGLWPSAARKPYEYGDGCGRRNSDQTIVTKGLFAMPGLLHSAEGGEEGVLRNVFSFVKDGFAGKIGSQVVNQPAPAFTHDAAFLILSEKITRSQSGLTLLKQTLNFFPCQVVRQRLLAAEGGFDNRALLLL
jgi:hypothetical protein